MKKYQLTGQPIYVGETYNHNGEFYYSTYHGKLSEADVEGCLARAEYMLHSLTLDRLQDGAWEQDETLAKCVRMAHCALADAQHAQDTAVLAGGKVTSESVGNCNFTEELQDWVQQQNRKGVPLSGDGLSFVSISASNGAFTDWDENFQYGVYKIQGTLIYEKE